MNLLFSMMLFVSFSALADGYTPHRGSVYLEGDTGNGGTYTQGINTRSNSAWSTTTEPDGSQYGIDSQGDTWSYDNQLDTYINHGTGEVCVSGFCN